MGRQYLGYAGIRALSLEEHAGNELCRAGSAKHQVLEATLKFHKSQHKPRTQTAIYLSIHIFLKSNLFVFPQTTVQ